MKKMLCVLVCSLLIGIQSGSAQEINSVRTLGNVTPEQFITLVNCNTKPTTPKLELGSREEKGNASYKMRLCDGVELTLLCHDIVEAVWIRYNGKPLGRHSAAFYADYVKAVQQVVLEGDDGLFNLGRNYFSPKGYSMKGGARLIKSQNHDACFYERGIGKEVYSFLKIVS